MKILVTHVYSKKNNGDAVLLSILLTDARRAFGDPHITILTLDKTEEGETFEGVPVKNSFMYYARDRYQNPLSRTMYATFVAISTLWWAFFYRITGKKFPLPKDLYRIARLYQEADLVIPVGGGYIRSKPGFMATVTLFFIIHPLLFAQILGKPTINYTQSIGPFGNKFQECMAKFALRKIDGIIVRENISLQLLKKWGITKNVFLSVDGAFSFLSEDVKNLREELGIPPGEIIVGLTVREWLKTSGQVKYEKALAIFCDHIIKKYNVIIMFIPQVTVENHKDDDRESAKRIYHLMEYKRNTRVLTERYDHKKIKAIYKELDYLIGTRFHSVIFALTSYVPSIAIEYEHKTGGIMADLTLEKWVIDIKKIEAARLAVLFDQLILDRESYINHLKKVLPPYIEKSQQSIYFVKQIYEQL
jgi:colanic acid/amylovoran biosynthesis protein